jgi:hypothetical protein
MTSQSSGPTQKILFTVLPNGFAPIKNSLFASVFVSPQLSPTSTGSLSDFPDLVKWPTLINALQFGFSVETYAKAPTVSRVSPPADLDLWSHIFSPNTKVGSFSQPEVKAIRSFPASTVRQRVASHYGAAFLESWNNTLNKNDGSSRAEFLSVKSVSDSLDTIRIFDPVDRFYPLRHDTASRPKAARQDSATPATEIDWKTSRSLRRLELHPTARVTQPSINNVAELEKELQQSGANAPCVCDDDKSCQKAFLQAALFYRRRPQAEGRAKPKLTQPEDLNEFHRYLSMFGNFPSLLRRLGLVIDIQIDFADPLEQLPTIGFCELVLPRLPGFIALRTAFQLTVGSKLFLPASQDSSYVSKGQLNLANEDYFSLECVEILDSAIKTLNSKEQCDRTQTHATADTPQDTALPPLRTGGLSVVQNGRALQLAKHLRDMQAVSTQLQSGTLQPLYAEQLMRGLRIDVWDNQTNAWHSLCKRRVTFHLTQDKNFAVAPIQDEGFITTSLSQPTGSSDTENGQDDDHYLHESLFKWDGWSLNVPAPGKGIRTSADTPRQGANELQSISISVGLPLAKGKETRSTANANAEREKPTILPTLPSLRFRDDMNYRFRARVVDLAGNSLTGDDALLDDTMAVPPAPQEGEGYCRFEPVPAPSTVLKDHLDPLESRGENIDRLVVRTSSEQSTASCDRVIVPPRTSAQMAERCGSFDEKPGGVPKLRKTAYSWMVDKDKDFCVDDDPDKPGNPHFSQNPIVCDPDHALFSVPYLPDPLCFGAAVTFHTNAGEQIAYSDLFADLPNGDNPFSFYPGRSTWPNPMSFLLRLRKGEGVARCSWKSGARQLDVHLPKAGILKLLVSANISENKKDDSHLQVMGIWKWAQDAYAAAISEHTATPDLATMDSLSLSGMHWMLAPQREITLIHAVKKPLMAPEFSSHLWAERLPGKTYATLQDFPLSVDGKSTSKVDVWARWEDEEDDLEKPVCEEVLGQAHVCELPVKYEDVGVKVDQRHNFGDTKYRAVTYSAEATSRFKDYFEDDFAKHPERYKIKGPEITLQVLSTARPDVPKLQYIVPTFRWVSESSKDGTEVVRKRMGGGLRVYLDRPWFSSGKGELLGVVLCPNQNLDDSSGASRSTLKAVAKKMVGGVLTVLDVGDDDPDPDDGHRPFFTQWGMDPNWKTNSLPDLPGVEHFRNYRQLGRGLTLEETQTPTPSPSATHLLDPGGSNSERFSVIGYDVHYDVDRKLWYSDIVMDPRTSYVPFVRLALVRYQPNSVFSADTQDCCLSRVVLTDFVQLLPDRWASLSYTSEGHEAATLTVYGVAPFSKQQSIPTNEINVFIQQRFDRLADQTDDEEMQWFSPDDKSAPIALRLQSHQEGVSVWTGTFSLPANRRRGQYRLLIEELETNPGDAPDRNIDSDPSDVKRVVYADAFDL